MKLSANKVHQQEVVLTKSILKLISFFDFTGKELGEIIGISEATASRLHQGKKLLSPHTKEGELALLLIRIYRGLNALVGNHHDKAKTWLNSHNHYFQNKPINAMKTVPGLVAVLNYLDAMRGKL